ncbi:hypothetical protein [Maribacter sp. 2308TA10-17]|uniref:hypothetical protein n=1 Tax=Maribacter sp. 2308TA10-17 TaxID=3386276 RepID=UPI0039BD5EE3
MLRTFISKSPPKFYTSDSFLLLMVLLLVSGICLAQDVIESPTSTVKGTAQIEIASSYESFKEGNEKSVGYTAGSLLFLYGVSDAVEIRFGMDFQQDGVRVNGRKPTSVESGYTPLQIGVGADLIKEKGIFPKISFIGDMFLPSTGGSDFKQDKLGFGLKAGFFHNLGKSHNAQLNYNLGADFGNDDLAYFYGITYLYNIGSIGGAYLELNGNLPDDFSPNHYISAAFYWTPTANIQFDTIVGRGINADQDFYLTGRLQIYIPNTKTKTTNQ